MAGENLHWSHGTLIKWIYALYAFMKSKSTPHLPASITYGAIVGQVVALKRQAGGLHQQSLADALGISQSAYSRLESGQSSMSLAQLRLLANEFGIQPHQLLEEVDGYAASLDERGVAVTDDKSASPSELLIGLGTLAALIAAAK